MDQVVRSFQVCQNLIKKDLDFKLFVRIAGSFEIEPKWPAGGRGGRKVFSTHIHLFLSFPLSYLWDREAIM